MNNRLLSGFLAGRSYADYLRAGGANIFTALQTFAGNALFNGIIYQTPTTLTISSGSITPTRSYHVVAAESGTSDTLDAADFSNFEDNAILRVAVDAGDTITITNNAVWKLTGGEDLVLTEGQEMLFAVNSTGGYAVEIGSSPDLGDPFVSSELTIPTSSPFVVSAAHGLGSGITHVQAELICKTGEHGYSVGDKVPVTFSRFFTSSAARGGSTRYDSTNIYFDFDNNGIGVSDVLDANRGPAIITPGNWKIILKGWVD